MDIDNPGKEATNAISKDSIKQIKMLVGHSEKASTDSIAAHQTLKKSINSISIGSSSIPDIVDNIQLLLVRSHLLSLNALTTSREARKSDSELADVSKNLELLSADIKENLNLIAEASKNIIATTTQCSHIVEDTTEEIGITELSA